MSEVSTISLFGYFKPPASSFSGRYLYQLSSFGLYPEEKQSRFSVFQKNYRFGMISFIFFSIVTTVSVNFLLTLDLAYWSFSTLAIRPVYQLGLKNHFTNLISFIALPILSCGMVFGCLPDVDAKRPFIGYKEDMNFRQTLAIFNNDVEAMIALIKQGASIRPFFRCLIERLYIYPITENHIVCFKIMLEEGRKKNDFKTSLQSTLEDLYISFLYANESEVNRENRKILLKMFIEADVYYNGANSLAYFYPYFEEAELFLDPIKKANTRIERCSAWKIDHEKDFFLKILGLDYLVKRGIEGMEYLCKIKNELQLTFQNAHKMAAKKKN